MDVDRLASWNKKFYSLAERASEGHEDQAIWLMRQFFRYLPFERLADCEVGDERLKTVLRGSTKDSGLELESSIILAAAYSEPYMLEKALKLGFAAVTAKCSRKPMEGNKGRKIIRTAEGPLNSIGYRNPGMVKTGKYLEKIRERVGPSKGIIVQISDSSIDNYLAVAQYMDMLDFRHEDPVAGMFELNRCPNCPDGKVLDFFRDHGYAKDLFREFRDVTKKPIALKLPRRKDCPDMYTKTIPIAVDNGITVLNYANGEYVEDSRFETGFGSRSGWRLYSDTLPNSYRIHNEFGDSADIIATGGIDSPYKAHEIQTKGHAKAVSCMTAFPGNIFIAKQINEYFRLQNK